MSVTQFNTTLERFGTDPVRVHKAQLQLLEKALNGEIDLVDPSNPFMMLLEANAVTVASWFKRDAISLRKQYPSMALEYSDLYRFMSNEDYVGRFSSPATDSVFKIYLHEAEIINKAVPVGNTGTRKLIIPRYTVIGVADMLFTLQYPIEIRVMAHGGLRVVYDTEVVSPLQTLESNGLDWQISLLENKRILQIDVPMWQFNRTVYSDTLNPSTGFKKSYQFEDQFYHCRVFGVSTSGQRKEYNITHSEEVYDPRTPTVLLQVTETQLTVEIPTIYFSTGLLNTKIEIELYTTKGQVRIDLGSYNAGAYQISWGDDFNSATDSVYSSPLSTLEIAGAYSASLVDSGSNGISFEELRDRVINNSNKVSLPITDAQLRSKLNIRGYDLILSVDDLTKRIYLATRKLPNSALDVFETGASCSIDTIQSNIANLAALPTVNDNGTRLTILPSTLYEYVDGVATIVPLGLRPEQVANSTDHLLTIVNEGQYAYSPLHYVLDTNYNAFDLRAYYLDAPEIISRVFLAENDTTQLSVSTRQYLITRESYGYRLVISSKVGTNYKAIPLDQLFVQLRFRPHIEVDYAYINGTFIDEIDGDYYWSFELHTDFDLDENDRIILKNFAMYIENPRDFLCDLEQHFEIIYAVSDYNAIGLQNSEIDDALGRHLLPSDVIGITQESAFISLGYAMKSLWTAARSIAGNIEYERYTQDVPWVYEKDVYLRDQSGAIAISLNDQNEITYTVLHKAGSPVLDDQNQPMFKHRKGEIVYDETGNPIEIETRNTQRQFDVLLVDGGYHYVNNATDVGYRDTIGPTIVSYLKDDLDAMQSSLLENTRLYFYPKRTLGSVKVITEAGIQTNIPAALSFNVRYFLTASNYVNFELRRSIEETTARIINEVLAKATVSVSDLIDRLKDELGNDIVAIDFDKLGPDGNITAFTAIDDGTRCSVRRKLMQLANGELALMEDISVSFVRHLV